MVWSGWCIWPTLTDLSSDVPSSFPAPEWSANCYHPSPFPLESFLRASLHHKEFSSILVITKKHGSAQFIPVSLLPVLLNLCFKCEKLFLKKNFFVSHCLFRLCSAWFFHTPPWHNHLANRFSLGFSWNFLCTPLLLNAVMCGTKLIVARASCMPFFWQHQQNWLV